MRIFRQLGRWIALSSLLVIFSACSGEPHDESGAASRTSTPVGRGTIRGAGASFPDLLYARWAERYYVRRRVRLEYKAVGSSEGILAIRRGEVDFGASDIPLDPDELEELGLVQMPIAAGSVVPVVHLPGIASERLVLDAETLAAIYLGKITRWNDPRLAALNEGLALPDEEIVPVYQKGRTGTNHLFVKFLRSHSETWRKASSGGDQVEWTVGVGAEGNDRAARFVRRFKHTIGYVEQSHAVANELTPTKLKTAEGAVVTISRGAVERAVGSAALRDECDLRVDFSRSGSQQGWPIVGVSYALVKRDPVRVRRSRRTLEFFRWALTEGRDELEGLDYSPVPRRFVPAIEACWRRYHLTHDASSPRREDSP